MADYDLSMLFPNDDDILNAQQQAQKMAGALRGQEMKGALLQAAGSDNPLDKLGGAMAGMGQKDLDSVQRYGPEQQMLKRITAAIRGGTTLDAAKTRADAQKYGYDARLEGVKYASDNAVRIGAGHDAARAAAMKMLGDQRFGAQSAKDAVAFGKDIDPDVNPGMKQYTQTVYQADRLKALATGDTGALRDLDKRQMEEMAIGLHRMFSGQSRGAQQQVQALLPSTPVGDVNKFVEWFTNTPTGLDQMRFVQSMADTIERERGAANQHIHDEQMRALTRHLPAVRALAASGDLPKILAASKIDPDEALNAIGGVNDNLGKQPLPPPPSPAPNAPSPPSPAPAPAGSGGGATPKRVKVDANGNIIG